MEPSSMSDSPASDAEQAMKQLVEKIRQEPIPECILELSRELQAALDFQQDKSGGTRTE